MEGIVGLERTTNRLKDYARRCSSWGGDGVDGRRWG